jgi:hypothetical protein
MRNNTIIQKYTTKTHIEKMLPLPTQTNYCNDGRTCFLWIHHYRDPSRVIVFPSIKQAYVFAERHALSIHARQFTVSDETRDPSQNIIWKAKNGTKWIAPELFWDNTLSKIYEDIETKNLDDDYTWMALSSNTHQILIGLGNDLPNTIRNSKYVQNTYRLENYETLLDRPKTSEQ